MNKIKTTLIAGVGALSLNSGNINSEQLSFSQKQIDNEKITHSDNSIYVKDKKEQYSSKIQKESKEEVLKQYIVNKCISYTGPASENKNYHDSSLNLNGKEKCILMSQAQIKHETNFCKLGNGKKNNCYGFRGSHRKDRYEKFGMSNKGNGSYSFKNPEGSIDFFIQRFYKFDVKKSVDRIIRGFAYTSTANQNNYIQEVNKYINQNKNRVKNIIP